MRRETMVRRGQNVEIAVQQIGCTRLSEGIGAERNEEN